MIFLDHFTAIFNHIDTVISRLLAIVGSLGALAVAVRALVQNLHASQAVETQEKWQSGVGGDFKKREAMIAMASAHPLLRASPARADRLIEAKWRKMKAGK